MTSNPLLPLIVRTGAASTLARANNVFRKCVGFENAELGAKPLIEWIHPDDQPALERALAANTGVVKARHQNATGGWVPFEWTVRAEAGEVYVLGRLCEEDADVGEVAPADIAAESMGQMLSAMALIVESTNPGLMCSILLVDKSSNAISVGAGPSFPAEYNQAVEGLQIGPLVGSCGTAAYWGVPVIVENIREDFLWRDLREAAAIAGVNACWSHPIRSTSDEVLGAMALYSKEASEPEQHHLNGLEIAARMVGLAIERFRLDEKLRHAAKMEALGVLAGGIAHDFNNLLAAILGNAELAMGSLPLDAPSQRMLAGIVRATDGATALCNQLLAYTGRGALSTETVECNTLIRELADLLQVTLSKKASLQFDLQGALHVVADRGQLRQVVMNLITNGAEAVGNAEGRLLVQTRLRQMKHADLVNAGVEAPLVPGEYIELVVGDTGCGMTAETQARIFDPFFTTKAEGRGLGLAAVLGIVQAHRGALLLESKLGIGTKFTVLLPRAAAPTIGQAPPPPSPSNATGARILVVDDEPAVLGVLSEMLATAGLRVIEACNGIEAIERFRRDSNDIDLVLLDLNMPKLDGEEVFRELRKIRSDVRVILSSGYTEQEVVDRFKGAGLAGVIQKPARYRELLDRIQGALEAPLQT